MLMTYLFAKYMNTRHKNSKFTFDFEQNNSFSFLDVKITHGSNRLSTSVFRKATFIGIFTNCDSFIFESYFYITISLFYILLRYTKFSFRSKQPRQIFKCNNCPVGLIHQCVKNRIYVPKIILITVPKKDILIVLPFLRQFSFNLRSRLNNCFNKMLPQCNIKVIFQSKNRLSNLCSFKGQAAFKQTN